MQRFQNKNILYDLARNGLGRLDPLLILPALVLTVLGILFIYSSGITSEGNLVSNEYLKQIAWSITGILIMIALAVLNYQRLKIVAPVFYGITIFILVLTLLFGREVNGARSWFGIGPFGIQISEITKLATIFFLASFLEDNYHQNKTFWVFLVSCGITFFPMGLILLQPDLGTALVFIPILLIVGFMSGLKLHYLFFIIFVGLISTIFIFIYAWNTNVTENYISLVRIFNDKILIKIIFIGLLGLLGLAVAGFFLLKNRIFYWISYVLIIIFASYLMTFMAVRILQNYQMMRLIVFLDPDVDPRGHGWHIIQSITAIGSGGPVGKGFLQGTQSHYRYLPQQSTDFIFSILAEEFGFIGSFVVFLMYGVIFSRILMISFRSNSRFGALIAIGILSVFFFHFLENIGMAMGIMPVTGIPLMFLSYGGSALWSSYASLGCLLSINNRKDQS